MFSGSIVALITPFKPDGEVDFECLQRLVEHHIAAGSDGIVSVGTTGESATLTIEEHVKVVNKTVEFAAGRIPVIAGTGANATHECVTFSRLLNGSGISACLSVTPYYNKPTQEGMYQHYKAIAEVSPSPPFSLIYPTSISTISSLSLHPLSLPSPLFSSIYPTSSPQHLFSFPLITPLPSFSHPTSSPFLIPLFLLLPNLHNPFPSPNPYHAFPISLFSSSYLPFVIHATITTLPFSPTPTSNSSRIPLQLNLPNPFLSPHPYLTPSPTLDPLFLLPLPHTTTPFFLPFIPNPTSNPPRTPLLQSLHNPFPSPHPLTHPSFYPFHSPPTSLLFPFLVSPSSSSYLTSTNPTSPSLSLSTPPPAITRTTPPFKYYTLSPFRIHSPPPLPSNENGGLTPPTNISRD